MSTLLATVQDVVGRAAEFVSLANTPWQPLTVYALNAKSVNGQNIYTATTAGTSAASGGPTGYGTGIADGSVVWAFTSLDPIATALNDAALQINAAAFGLRTQLAQTYLAAHLLSVRNPQLALPAGPVRRDMVGQVQTEYAVNAAPANEADYNTSRWGQAFRTLCRQLMSGRVMVTGGVSVTNDPDQLQVFTVNPNV